MRREIERASMQFDKTKNHKMTKCVPILDHNRLARENVSSASWENVWTKENIERKKKNTHRKQFRNQIGTVWSFCFCRGIECNARTVEVAKDRHYYHRSLSIISNIRLVDRNLGILVQTWLMISQPRKYRSINWTHYTLMIEPNEMLSAFSFIHVLYIFIEVRQRQRERVN